MKIKFNEMANGQLANVLIENTQMKCKVTDEFNEVDLQGLGIKGRILAESGKFRVTWETEKNYFESDRKASPIYDDINSLLREWVRIPNIW